MIRGMAESMLVVEVEEAEPLVRHWRRKYDPNAALGLPAHVTALYPFRAPELLGERDLGGLARLAAQTDRFQFALSAIDEQPGAISLRPVPDNHFRMLAARLSEAFPDRPPPEGLGDAQPTLVVARLAKPDDQARVRQALAVGIEGSLPVACVATALALYVSDRVGMWSCIGRFPFR
ncbi:MAG: 2'-5' RNA ligase family protein [Actinomycetota bacterium]|nr:2'-5' RNA ligase family protein [Actinomycetota bacterium]